MSRLQVVQGRSGVRVAWRVAVADSFWRRLRGLRSHAPLRTGDGLLLLECASVHTVGMRYPIDIAFLDADGTVVRTIAALSPWRVGIGGEGAVHALELPPGRLVETGTVTGDRLSWS